MYRIVQHSNNIYNFRKAFLSIYNKVLNNPSADYRITDERCLILAVAWEFINALGELDCLYGVGFGILVENDEK